MLVSTFLWWHWSRNEVWQLNHIHGWNETKNARLKHFTLSLEPWRTCPRICSLWKLKIGSIDSKWAVNYIPTVFVFRSTTLLIRYFERKVQIEHGFIFDEMEGGSPWTMVVQNKCDYCVIYTSYATSAWEDYAHSSSSIRRRDCSILHVNWFWNKIMRSKYLNPGIFVRQPAQIYGKLFTLKYKMEGLLNREEDQIVR